MAQEFIDSIDLTNHQILNFVVHSSAIAPGVPTAGMMWWDSGNSIMKHHDGSAWLKHTTGPEVTVVGKIPQWDNITGSKLSTGLSLQTEVRLVGALDTAIPTELAVRTAINSSVLDKATAKGLYNATTNNPDLDITPSGVKKGDIYHVSVAGTFFSTVVAVGDVLIANTDNATLESHWSVLQKKLPTIQTLATGGTELNISSVSHGQLLIGNGTTGKLVLAAPTGVDGITVTKGAGTLQFSLNVASLPNINLLEATDVIAVYDVSAGVNKHITFEDLKTSFGDLGGNLTVESLFEVVNPGTANEFIRAKKHFVSVGAIGAYKTDSSAFPSLWDSLPIATDTTKGGFILDSSQMEITLGVLSIKSNILAPAIHGNENHSSTFITSAALSPYYTSVQTDSAISSAITGKASISGTPVNNQIAIWTGATAIKGDSKMTWDGTNLTITGNILASGAIVAFATEAPAGWWAAMPYATNSSVGGFILWDTQFTMTEGVLKIKDSVLVPASHGNANHTETYITTAALSSYALLAGASFSGAISAPSIYEDGALLASKYAPIANPSHTGYVHVYANNPYFNNQTNSAGTGASPVHRKYRWSKYTGDEVGSIDLLDMLQESHRTDMLFSTTHSDGNIYTDMLLSDGFLRIAGSYITNGGDFHFKDAGTVDVSAVRLFSSGGNLYLQYGSNGHLFFRNSVGGTIGTLYESSGWNTLILESTYGSILKLNSTYNGGNGVEFYQDASGNIMINSNSATNVMSITPAGIVTSPEFTAGSSRPVTITNGAVYQKGDAGSWSIPYGFIGSAGTVRGGYGAMGGSDEINYFWIGKDYNHFGIAVVPDGAVDLYYGTGKKLQTTSTGIAVTGNITASGNIIAYSS